MVQQIIIERSKAHYGLHSARADIDNIALIAVNDVGTLLNEVDRLEKETDRLKRLGCSFRTAIFNYGLACETCKHNPPPCGNCVSYDNWLFNEVRFSDGDSNV